MIGMLGSLGSSIMRGLGGAGGLLKNFLESAGGSGFGEVTKGIGGLLSAGSGMYGAYNQSKMAKDMLNLQKRMYNDWNSTRLGNENNLAQGYNDVFGDNNAFFKKKLGMLDSKLY